MKNGEPATDEESMGLDDNHEKDQEELTDHGGTHPPEEGVSSSKEASPLPPTKNRRTYSCNGNCQFNSKNPRQYLYHRRDHHKDKIQIFACEQCVYASKQSQKLERHIQMVHEKRVPTATYAISPMIPSPIKMVTRSKERKSAGNSFDDYIDGEEYEETFDNLEEEGDEPKDGEVAENSCSDKDAVESDSKNDQSVNNNTDTPSAKCKSYFCHRCKKVISDEEHYKKHLPTSPNAKYKCSWCEFSTDISTVLLKHMKFHEGPKTKTQSGLDT
ncbi:hypothetical protein GQR58_004032 [Nymphon striatum]|nr:hypothetical protein GQR58_004032 [Nymphon striatum]